MMSGVKDHLRDVANLVSSDHVDEPNAEGTDPVDGDGNDDHEDKKVEEPLRVSFKDSAFTPLTPPSVPKDEDLPGEVRHFDIEGSIANDPSILPELVGPDSLADLDDEVNVTGDVDSYSSLEEEDGSGSEELEGLFYDGEPLENDVPSEITVEHSPPSYDDQQGSSQRMRLHQYDSVFGEI